MNRRQARAEGQLRKLADAIEAGHSRRSGSGPTRPSVERESKAWTRREHLQEILEVDLETEDDRIVALRRHWNLETNRTPQHRWLGQLVLVTGH